MNQCPVCGADSLLTLLSWEASPILVEATAGKREDALQTTTGPLNITQCQYCGFVFNRGFKAKKFNIHPNTM